MELASTSPFRRSSCSPAQCWCSAPSSPAPPRTTFLVAWGYSVGWGLLLSDYQPFAALAVALYRVGRSRPLRHALPYLGAVAVPVGIDTANAHAPTARVAAAVAFVWCLAAGAVWAAARRRFSADAVVQAREAMLFARAEVDLRNERLRMARELHDTVAHSVTVILMQSAGARAMSARGEEVPEALAVIESAAGEAMRELRQMLGLLSVRRGESSNMSDVGLQFADVERLIEATEACGLRVARIERGEPRPLPSPLENLGYRVVQESLTNALKYADIECPTTVEVDWAAGRLRIAVYSQGSRHDPLLPPSAGVGLGGLRSRVRAIGGAFAAGWAGPGVFVVEAELPLTNRVDRRTRSETEPNPRTARALAALTGRPGRPRRPPSERTALSLACALPDRVAGTLDLKAPT